MTQSSKPKILMLSAYDAGSHKRWREQLIDSQPDFEWHSLVLPPRFFRWRIRSNALSWLHAPELQQQWDGLVVTSMVDLASIKGLQPQLARTPSLLYMHENQFAYPDSGHQHASADPKMVNLMSAIAADQVVFNSEWNRTSFFEQAQAFLDRMPDKLPDGLMAGIRAKSAVVPVPIADDLFVERSTPLNLSAPHLLWNHRWEYDKAPERLLALLEKLQAAGQVFSLSVVGEQFRSQPAVFEQIRERFSGVIRHWGFLERRADYDQLLASADIVISTALHDFQGLSMLEAMASGCLALAPDRLAYPEYVHESQRYESSLDDAEKETSAAVSRLLTMLDSPIPNLTPGDWRLSQLASEYRRMLAELVRQG